MFLGTTFQTVYHLRAVSFTKSTPATANLLTGQHISCRPGSWTNKLHKLPTSCQRDYCAKVPPHGDHLYCLSKSLMIPGACVLTTAMSMRGPKRTHIPCH